MRNKLCFIGGGLAGGGQERSLTNLANYFSEKGYVITIINLFKTEQFYALDEKISVLWPSIDRKKYHRIIYAILLLPYLRKNIKNISPNIILSFGEWFNPYIILATRCLNIKIFALERMGPILKLDPLIEIFRKFLYKYATGIIVQTAAAAKIVSEKTSATNIKIIPNPLNPINVNMKLKKKKIVSVGRLAPEKGHIVLIRAFSKLQNSDWELDLIGDGTEKEVLENEATKLGTRERIHFWGHLKDFSKILSESEIFVLPSFHEGFPNALLEAMSVPLACISSDCVAGPSEIIEHGINGLLVKPGDVEELAAAIDSLINNPDLRNKLANEAFKVRERYNFDKIAKEYLDFIFK